MNDKELDRERLGAAERETGAAGLGRGGRMSRQRKTAAVIRLLCGEDLEGTVKLGSGRLVGADRVR